MTPSPTASSICGSRSRVAIAPISAAQRQQQVADMRGSTSQLAMSATKLDLRSWKADQHRALLDDVAHRQARALPVVPGRALDRPQHALGPHLAEMPERVLERALLGRDLRGDVRGAASCSRRRRRSAGSAARRAASSHGAARPAPPAPSCSCGAAPRRAPPRQASASSTKTTLPSALWATPCASRSSDSIRSHSSALVMRRLSGPRRAAKLRPPGESFVRAKPPKAQTGLRRGRTLRHRGLANACSQASSLERGPPRAGPPKGQATSFAALPISQVERTAGAVFRRGASPCGRETCSGADRCPTRIPPRRC